MPLNSSAARVQQVCRTAAIPVHSFMTSPFTYFMLQYIKSCVEGEVYVAAVVQTIAIFLFRIINDPYKALKAHLYMVCALSYGNEVPNQCFLSY